MKREVSSLRISNVAFLNSRPYQAVSDIPWVSYEECDPAECARRLHEDETDLALIPLAEAILHGGYRFLDYGIISRDEVRSVYLFSNNKLADLRKVYVDNKSHSSFRLLQVLSSNKDLKYFRTDVSKISTLEEGAGILVIGDSALCNRVKYNYKLDLAKLWQEKTSLPFVFAVWAYRDGRLSQEVIDALYQCFEKGILERESLARSWAKENKQNESEIVDYLKNCISYVLDEDARLGIEKFSELGEEKNFLPTASRAGTEPRPHTGVEEQANRLPVGAGLRPRPQLAHSSIETILNDAAAGKRISISEALRLANHASLADLALAADFRRESLHKNSGVSYIIDRNINYTNVCNVYCRFCAFYEAPGKGGYLLSKKELGEKIQETVDAGGIQILLQGGVNPDLKIEYYEDLFRWIKENYPVNLHALSSDEIIYIAEISELSFEETILRLIKAGLGSLPGAGAELLVDRVRRRIARLKSSADTWLEVHRVAHRLGITSTCTMLFGVKESWEDRMLHMHKLRNLQDETGGFTAFITWPFQEENTKLKAGDVTSLEYLRVQAVARLFLDNIPNIQSSWVTMGQSIGQVALYFGANDFGSLMFEENVVSSAGTTYCMNEGLIREHIEHAGFRAWRRDVHYGAV